MSFGDLLRNLRTEATSDAKRRAKSAQVDLTAYLLERFEACKDRWEVKARNGEKSALLIKHTSLAKRFSKDLDVYSAMEKFCSKYRKHQGIRLVVEDITTYEQRGPMTKRYPLRVIRALWG